MTGTASTAAATLRNTTVSCSGFAGGREAVSGLSAALAISLAAVATLARARPDGQTSGRRLMDRPPAGGGCVARSQQPADTGIRAGKTTGRAVAPVRGRCEPAHLQEGDRSKHRRRLVTRRRHELVDRAVARDEGCRDLACGGADLDQHRIQRRVPAATASLVGPAVEPEVDEQLGDAGDDSDDVAELPI